MEGHYYNFNRGLYQCIKVSSSEVIFDRRDCMGHVTFTLKEFNDLVNAGKIVLVK